MSQYLSQKYLSQKSLGIGLENFGLKIKSWYPYQKFWFKKKCQCWSRKIWSKKNLGTGPKNFGPNKSLGISHISR